MRLLREDEGLAAQTLRRRVLARDLGLVSGLTLDTLHTTKLGDELLLAEMDSPAERAVYAKAIAASKPLTPFAEFLRGDAELTIDLLAHRIGVMTKMSLSTARRRAQTLVAWRKYLHGDTIPAATTTHVEQAAAIEKQIQAQNAKAREEMLEQLQKMQPKHFEKLIAKLCHAMKYESVTVTGGAGDGGVDVRAKRVDQWSPQLKHPVILQAKRYKKTVNRRYVDELIGVMTREKCNEALLITTGVFTDAAREAAADVKGLTLTLVDGTALVLRLIEAGVGASQKNGVIVADLKAAFAVKSAAK